MDAVDATDTTEPSPGPLGPGAGGRGGDGVNAEQRARWNDVVGPSWVGVAEAVEAQYRPLGLLAMDRVGVATGARVLDVGCGCGHTTMELARRAGPAGTALGVDIAPVMIARAAGNAAAARVANATFAVGDAQTHPFAPSAFDLVFSRFGIMFFDDPVAAFANLRRALRPGGSLAFVCWGPAEANAWSGGARALAARFVDLPPAPPPGAPGPHALAEPGRIREVLAAAGLVEVALAEVRTTVLVAGAGASLDEAVAFQCRIGPGREVAAADPAAASAYAAAMAEHLSACRTAEGFPAEVCINVVSAVAPAVAGAILTGG